MNGVHMSQFAAELRCAHCGQAHGTTEWPERGDQVPFYYQTEPGNHALPVDCPHCAQRWYVVWDDDPGPVKTLFLA
jgi:Zn finger protein HypA/HybF involved in hydrogenase expression